MNKLAALVIIVALLSLVTVAPMAHDAYVWHQIEKQALAADLAEGEQG